MAIVARPRLPVTRLLELQEFLDGLVSALPFERHVRGGDGDERTEAQTTWTVRCGRSVTGTGCETDT